MYYFCYQKRKNILKISLRQFHATLTNLKLQHITVLVKCLQKRNPKCNDLHLCPSSATFLGTLFSHLSVLALPPFWVLCFLTSKRWCAWDGTRVPNHDAKSG